ncbi:MULTISPECIES: HAMP domain-containing sensor histidine kinase [unclassified Methylophaga]|jgi:signal transduction histidine kinase|uniref:sensor histidine kinase n=2 Tax=Methylophaga TaxID=40222 RepID=UPI000C97F505|nr:MULTISPECIES: HAMP domain-containing sensor histidine kinase [unclassified Methylophaga]MAY16866.1 two-component sensor histidine kinase [Methylophaga sp.]|tara:strand:+ start:2394 stop:3854 length:1461 start_codon:yes stop_codon:yes gene_type:complete
MKRIFKKLQSIQGALRFHELSFVVLIVMTALMSFNWALAWQKSSEESLRLSSMNTHVQHLRGDLYRQLKEVFDVVFLNDVLAIEEYYQFRNQIDSYLLRLKVLAQTPTEEILIVRIEYVYNKFYQETSRFLDLEELSSEDKVWLDEQLEEQTFRQLEMVFSDIEDYLKQQQLQLTASDERMFGKMILSEALPIILALILLSISKWFVRRNMLAPLRNVTKGAKIISTGDFKHHIPLKGLEELQRLSQAINSMADELASNRDQLIETKKQAALGELVPLVAHNIRNPLAGIRAAAQVSIDDANEESRAVLKDIIIAVDRLENWVTSLLMYLHPLKPHMIEVTLTELTDNALSLIELQLTEKSIQLNRHGWQQAARQINMDNNLMEQAIFNLIQNGIEASPVDSSINIHYWETPQMIGLHIDDQGSGFSHKPDEKNSQLHKKLSYGLGIPFAQKVIKQHHGDLAFETNSHGGARVSLTLHVNDKQANK